MKTFTEERFKHVVSVIITAFVLAMMPTVAQGDASNKSVRSEATDTRCYNIPYTRDQLNNIQKNKGAALEKLVNDIEQIIREEGIGQIVGIPQVIYGNDEQSQVCFEIKKGYRLITKSRLA